jgi:hypothetical protein
VAGSPTAVSRQRTAITDNPQVRAPQSLHIHDREPSQDRYAPRGALRRR